MGKPKGQKVGFGQLSIVPPVLVQVGLGSIVLLRGHFPSRGRSSARAELRRTCRKPFEKSAGCFGPLGFLMVTAFLLSVPLLVYAETPFCFYCNRFSRPAFPRHTRKQLISNHKASTNLPRKNSACASARGARFKSDVPLPTSLACGQNKTTLNNY